MPCSNAHALTQQMASTTHAAFLLKDAKGEERGTPGGEPFARLRCGDGSGQTSPTGMCSRIESKGRGEAEHHHTQSSVRHSLQSQRTPAEKALGRITKKKEGSRCESYRSETG